jgi:DNA recombination protein RmuC
MFLRARDAALLGNAREKAAVLDSEAAGLRAHTTALTAELAESRGRVETLVKTQAGLDATLAAERRGVEQARAALADSFSKLSRDALEQNNTAFLDRAKETLVAPIAQSLAKVDGQIQSIEKERAGAYAALSQQLTGMVTAQQRLETETGKLAGALRSSNVRGNWGQLQLRRVLESADLADHYDFEEQLTLASGDRPDVVIHLAGNRDIAVDAKAPMQAFLDALDAPTEAVRTAKLQEHALQLRARVNELSAKAYWSQLPRSLDLVVLFVPSESLFHSALQYDERLLEEAFAKKVVFATPLTLLALLRAVALGWREERIAENAREISEQGKTLYERMRVLAEHLTKIGSGLGRAVEAYNASVGSLERQVLPAARKMKELGAGSDKDIEPLERVETEVRPVIAAELAPHERS